MILVFNYQDGSKASSPVFQTDLLILPPSWLPFGAGLLLDRSLNILSGSGEHGDPEHHPGCS
jgi:hypothetical protein